MFGNWHATALFWKPQVALLVNEMTSLCSLDRAPTRQENARRLPRAFPYSGEASRKHSMRRRQFMLQSVVASGAPVFAITARPQPQRPLPIIGFLGSTAPAPELVKSFLAGLSDGGVEVGRDVAIEYRWAHNRMDGLAPLVAELLHQRAAILVTIGGIPVAKAAKAATRTIPILFEVGRDPVASGLVTSLNRPGGNATGVHMLTSSLNAKRLELLRELVPRATTVAVLTNPTNIGQPAVEREIRTVAPTFGFEPLIARASSEAEIETAFEMFVDRKVGALVVANDAFFNSRRAQLVALTNLHSLPTVFEWREFAAEGGLMSYGTDLSDVLRQLGNYAARVLKGAKPEDLPVLQPTRFELVINERTARALGLTIPQALLLRASEIVR